MNLLIRKATIEDARRISYLIRKNAEHVKENNYTSEQMSAWKFENTLKATKDKLSKRSIFCAFENKKLVGTVGLEGDYLVGFFISYSKRGKGVGYRLLKFIEDYALQKNIDELHLTATPNGYGFYLKHGYESQGEVELFFSGIKFIETKMKKKLSS